jgi:ketosteroid isomerase-like protein
VDTAAAARRWVEVWASAWMAKDVDAIVDLYSPDATYLSVPFGDGERGTQGVRRYLVGNFDVEDEIECWFGSPIVAGGQAAIEWWGTWIEDGQPVTLAGASVLKFDTEGLVVDHRDYWNQMDERRPPYPGWLGDSQQRAPIG